MANSALFLIALIALFVLWSQVAGQGHVDLVPWHVKLALGVGAAFAFARAAAAAAAHENPWNGRTLRWAGILVALLIGCGLATYYVHLYYEDDDAGDEDEPNVSSLSLEARIVRVYEPSNETGQASGLVLPALRGPGRSGPGADICRVGGARLHHQ